MKVEATCPTPKVSTIKGQLLPEINTPLSALYIPSEEEHVEPSIVLPGKQQSVLCYYKSGSNMATMKMV